jgi:hypothetical protein
MVIKLQMPNGGGVVVLAEDINAIEIGPTPTDGTQPVTTIFMRGGATHPILRGDGEQVMALMGGIASGERGVIAEYAEHESNASRNPLAK